MTDEQRAYWQAYVDEIKPIMRVSDWRIQVSDEPAEPGNDAQMWFKQNQPSVTLRLCADFDARPRDEQRVIVAHELLHCHTHHPWETVNRITDLLGRKAESIADESFCAQMEFMVDQLAFVIAPFLPLPPKVKKRAA
jgi:hypothetical protein